MYKLIYSENSIEKIDYFTKGYKNSFIKLFKDSGLLMEKEIVNNYIKLGNRLHELIFENINYIFSQNIILGISKTQSGELFTTISINNFRLFVYYSEIKNEHLRTINNIEFLKK